MRARQGLARRLGLAGGFAAPFAGWGDGGWVDGALAAVEERALWSRFGL